MRTAFMAATCPEEKFRDGKTAVKFAESCLKASGTATNKRASMIVLAIAQAEVGEHQKAVQTVVQAAKIGTPHPEVVQSCQKLAALFRQGKAYRHDPTNKKEQIFSLDPAIPFFGHR